MWDMTGFTGNGIHMGLDIRTGGKENLPIYAIEEGYISRVKIEAGGYGLIARRRCGNIG